jgi:general secretion pathway protein D
MNRLFKNMIKLTPVRRSAGRTKYLTIVLTVLLGTAGCAAGRGAYRQGIEAEVSRNYEEALTHYQAALDEDPGEIEYRLKVNQVRFAAAFQHFENGRRALEAGELEVARSEFIRTIELDPTHELARVELERTDLLMQSDAAEIPSAAEVFEVRKELARTDPSLDLQLSPTITTISFRITQEAQAIYETIAELSGLNVIFDPDFRSTQISVELDDVSVYNALDILGLQTRTFWTPINQNTFIVSPDNQQKRRDYENHVLKTIYLTNSVNPTDITEAITAIRTLLNVRFIAQSTSMNAIIIRDTPGRVAIAEKIIDDIDKSKPEVLVEATVLEVDRNTLRELGILPPQGTSIGLTGATGGGDDGASAGSRTQVNLRDFDNLNSGSFNIVIPDGIAKFLESDSRTRLVQNPSVRATDGQLATIRIGSRVPVAQGSFQPAFVGATGTPVVQFQYIDVGVNMDITPRVLLNREISMQVVVQVQATAGNNIISGVSLPVFTNREITHEIRLSEGETNILGGLITNTETVAMSGIPGLSKIPILGHLFSTEQAQRDQTEIIILLTPHIVKMPNLRDRNLQGLLVGTETNTRFLGIPGLAGDAIEPAAPTLAPEAEPATELEIGEDRLSFDVPVVMIESGAQTQLGIFVDTPNMTGADFTIEFDPSMVALRQISDGGFLSQDGTSIALVQNIDNEQGRAVVTVERPNLADAVRGQGQILELTLEVLDGGRSALRIRDVEVRSTGTPPRGAPATEIQITAP